MHTEVVLGKYCNVMLGNETPDSRIRAVSNHNAKIPQAYVNVRTSVRNDFKLFSRVTGIITYFHR